MLHPAIPFVMAAALMPWLKGMPKKILLLAVPLLSFWMLEQLGPNALLEIRCLDLELIPVRTDRLAMLFSYVFLLITLLANIYALHVDNAREHTASMLYAASTLGAVLAGDLLTFFISIELMALTAACIVWLGSTSLTTSGGQRDSTGAGLRYFLMHILGGALIFAGILLHYIQSKSLYFGPLSIDTAGLLIMAGIALNAAAPPMHAWLPDAYPRSSITGAVYLSALTTKTAVYALLRGFAGAEILAWLGAFMAFYGVVFALMENDIRRLLSYHIVSQVGYMVCGVGLGTALALNGAAAHAFCHILYKGLLFMAAGAVIYVSGRSKLTELGGLGIWFPWIFIFYMAGAFSISGVPLFNGFISKSMVVSAAEYSPHRLIEFLLIAAGVGTFLSVGLKLPYYAFLNKRSSISSPKTLPINMTIAMACASAICLILGLFPSLLYNLLPAGVEYHPYTASHILGSIQLLCVTGFVFALLAQKLAPDSGISLDVDWVYRKAAPSIISPVLNFLDQAEIRISRALNTAGSKLLDIWKKPVDSGEFSLNRHLWAAAAALCILLALLWRAS